jgi:hypothetical protein
MIYKPIHIRAHINTRKNAVRSPFQGQDDGDRPLATVKYTKIRYATLEADTNMDYITHITRDVDIGAS